MLQRLFTLLFSLAFNSMLIARDTIPVPAVNTVNGLNVISWVNSSKTITAINIQRSFDSSKNFITIGSVPVVKNGNDHFTDKQLQKGKVFYRLFIAFKGGDFLFTSSSSPGSKTISNNVVKKDRPAVEIKNLQKDSPAVITTDSPSVTTTEPLPVKQLKEVKVITKIPLIEQDIDKLTYNVEGDPESRSVSALEILRKIPAIIIDAEDNIQLSGSTNFLVLVNGRKSSLFVRSPKDVFKSMPASSIKKIEIITDPSSRYEAEGVGIINIIMNRKMVNGYNGSANLTVSSPMGFTAGANLTAKTKKFGFSSYIGSSDLENTSKSDFFRENISQKNTLVQEGQSKTNNASRFWGIELSYELDSLNLFTANYSGNVSRGDNNFNQHVRLLNASGGVFDEYGYTNTGETKWKGNDLGIDYQRNFKKNNDQLLTLSYQLNNNISSNPSFYNQQKANTVQSNYSDSRDTYTEHTAQADYVSSSKNESIELGIKSIFRFNKSDYQFKSQLPGSPVYILDSAQSNNFNYNQSIYAAYTSYTFKKRSFGMKIGARLEQTEVVARFRSTRSIATQSYLNLIPNFTISQKLKGPGVIKISYTQRIERPGLYYLNPYIDVSDPKNISYGNPDIRPALNNVVHLTYNGLKGSSSFNVGMFYNFTNSSIQRFTTLGLDSIARTTYGNIGKYQSSGISLNGMTTLFKNLSMNLNSSIHYVKFTGLINSLSRDNAGFSYSVFAYGTYRFEKGWRTSGNIGHSSPNILLQGKTSGYTLHSISIQKDLLKNKLGSVTFSVTSPFKKYRRFFTEINDPEFYMLQQSFITVRRFNVSYNYRFGKLEDDITRKKRGIKNDDLKSGDEVKNN